MNKLFPIGGNVLIVTISILINKDVFEPSYTPWKESYDQPRQHILQASLQQYVNHELRDVQAGFRKGRGTRDQIDNIHWIMEQARDFQKNIYFCFIDYAKAFDRVDHNKLENSSRDGNTRPPTCLLRNLYVGQEATVRTGHGTTDWFQIGNGEGNGNPLQCSCLENPRDRGAWWAKRAPEKHLFLLY